MPAAIIDDLRAAFDATTVLTGNEIDARYHTDMAGIPVAPPLAVMRPRTHRGRLEIPEALSSGARARDDPGRHDGPRARHHAAAGRDRAVDGAHERDRGGRYRRRRSSSPRPACRCSACRSASREHGFMFPLDLGARGSCTIGGNISTNAGGNRVIRYGMTRDLVLGLEAVLADGTVLKGVRKYIKNNTGIDLKQLFVGTEGTLGVVTRAALRIFPAPAEQQVALCALPSFDKVRALLELVAHAARRRPHRLRGDVERVLPPHDRAGERRRRAAADQSSLLRPAGILRQRRRAHPQRSRESCSSKALERGDHPRCDDCKLGCSGRGDLEDPRLLASSSAARSAPTASASTSASPSTRMEAFADTINKALKKIDKDAYRDRVRPCRRRQSARQRQIFAADRQDRGSHEDSSTASPPISPARSRPSTASASLKRPYLKLSRTAEEIETMRTLEARAGPASHPQSRADFYDVMLGGRRRSGLGACSGVGVSHTQLSSSAKADDPVFQRRRGWSREAAAYWMPRSSPGHDSGECCGDRAPFRLTPPPARAAGRSRCASNGRAAWCRWRRPARRARRSGGPSSRNCRPPSRAR